MIGPAILSARKEIVKKPLKSQQRLFSLEKTGYIL